MCPAQLVRQFFSLQPQLPITRKDICSSRQASLTATFTWNCWLVFSPMCHIAWLSRDNVSAINVPRSLVRARVVDRHQCLHTTPHSIRAGPESTLHCQCTTYIELGEHAMQCNAALAIAIASLLLFNISPLHDSAHLSLCISPCRC